MGRILSRSMQPLSCRKGLLEHTPSRRLSNKILLLGRCAAGPLQSRLLLPNWNRDGQSALPFRFVLCKRRCLRALSSWPLRGDATPHCRHTVYVMLCGSLPCTGWSVVGAQGLSGLPNRTMERGTGVCTDGLHTVHSGKGRHAGRVHK
jgi:hypothetical protein